MNYTPQNRFPRLFTDFDNIKDFPWLFKKISWLFPDLEKFSFFSDFSLTVATLLTTILLLQLPKVHNNLAQLLNSSVSG